MNSATSDPEIPTGLIQIGSQVVLELVYTDETERMELVVVPNEQADFSAGFLGAGTPLARAILGRAAGDCIPYGQGDARSVRIIAVRESGAVPVEDPAIRREERIRQVVEQSRRTDAMIFASSFSGKWGDYDPKGIEHWEDESQ